MKFLQKYPENTLRFFIILISVYTLLIIIPTLFKATISHKLSVDDSRKSLNGVVTDVQEGGAADKGGLKAGDSIIAVNGKRVSDLYDISNEINSLKSGEPAFYTVIRNGNILELEIFPYKYFHLIFYIFAILGLGLFINGFFVGFSKPKELTSQLFFLLGVSASCGFYPLNGAWYYTGLYNYFFWNHVLYNTFIFPLFFHFFSVYPIYIKFRKRKTILLLVYAYIILLQLVMITDLSAVLYSVSPVLLTALDYSPHIILIAGIWMFLSSYRKIREPEARKPLKILLIGLITGFAGLLYYFVIFMPFLMRENLNPVFRIPAVFVLAIPVTFGYSIFKYRILDTEFILKRSIVFGIVTVFITASYLFIVSFLDTLLEYYKLENKQFVTITTVIMIIFTFSYINKIAKSFVDKRFFRGRYNYRKTLLNFSDELPYFNDIDQVLKKLSSTINGTMGVSDTKIWVCDNRYKSLTEGIPRSLAECCNPDETDSTGTLRSGHEKRDLTDIKVNAGDFFRYLFSENKNPKRLYDINLREMNTPDNFREFVNAQKIVLSIPILIRNDLVGTLNFGEKAGNAPYSDEDTDLLKTIASQTAVVFENARLKKEEIKKNKLEEELNIAKKIQTGLLPPGRFDFEKISVSCSTLPARTVGGDFYDVIKIDDNKVLIVIADVSGKGIPAALYMAKVQAMIRFASKILKTPKDILTEVNKQVYEKFEKNFFVTAALALFDLSRGTVSIARAGHNPVLFSDNGTIDIIHSKGMGLGLNNDRLFDDNLEEKEIKLKPESMFIFYTDGLNEAMNRDKEEYGMERIIELSTSLKNRAPEDIGSGIMKSVKEFMLEAEQHDDITLVIVKSK